MREDRRLILDNEVLFEEVTIDQSRSERMRHEDVLLTLESHATLREFQCKG